MTTVLNGLLGGLLAGVIAAVAARRARGEPPAVGSLLAWVVGNRNARARWAGHAARLAYGGVAGAALVTLELTVVSALAVPPGLGAALGIAVAWSAVLAGLLVVGRRLAAAIPFCHAPLRELLTYHLVFGLGLGIWIRLTWIT